MAKWTLDLLHEGVMHDHSESDLGAVLDPRYLKLNQTTPQTITASPIISSLTGSKVVFTTSDKILTSTGIGTSAQFIKGDGSLDSSTYLTSFTEADTLATVTGRGATTSTVSTFSTAIKTPKIYPSADSTTAIQILKADGVTSVLNVDTTNARVGIGTTSPGMQLDLGGFGSQVSIGMTPNFVAGIKGNVDGSSGIQMYNATNGTNSDFRFAVFNNDRTNNISFVSPSNANTATNFGFQRNTSDYIWNYALSGSPRNLTVGTYSAGNLIFGTNNVERMRILSTGNVGIGTTTPTNLLSLGGNSARTFWLERHTTSNTAGNSLTITAGGATSGATDKAGGNLLLQGGLSTGTGESGVSIYGCVAGASGTTDRTQTIAIQTLGNKIGFFAGTPIVKQSFIAYTANNQSAAYTGAADGEAKLADLNALRVAYENLRLAYEDLKSKMVATTLVTSA